MLVSAHVQCQVNFHQQSKHKKSSTSRASPQAMIRSRVMSKSLTMSEIMGDKILEKSKDLSDSQKLQAFLAGIVNLSQLGGQISSFLPHRE